MEERYVWIYIFAFMNAFLNLSEFELELSFYNLDDGHVWLPCRAPLTASVFTDSELSL
jgi:hypothetical protein